MSNQLTKEQLAALGNKSQEPFKVPEVMFIHTTPRNLTALTSHDRRKNRSMDIATVTP